MMAAVALFCLTCTSVLFTSCSNDDVPVVPDEPTLTLISSDFTAGEGIVLAKNMIHAGDYSLKFITSKPIELDPNDFKVTVETDGATVTPMFPVDIDLTGVDNPDIKITTFQNSDNEWTVKINVLLPYMVLGQQFNFLLNYKGKPVGEPLRLEYSRPYCFEFEGSTDGYLSPGKTYPINIHAVLIDAPAITKDDIIAPGSYGMEPAHKDEFEVDTYDETGMPYVKILDTFTFTDAEKKAGYALICPIVFISGITDVVFQVVPVKVPANN